VRGNFVGQVCKKISVKLFNVLHGEKGLTHVNLVEYFLLLVVISIILVVMAMKVSEVHAKLLAKINSGLF
jgi:Na+(H+)/acetate symporter ActP